VLGDERLKPGETEHLTLGVVGLYQPIAVEECFSRSVTLKLSASDPSPASGVSSMRFRNGGTTTWSSWSSYSTSKSWTLTAGGGTKTVYVQYRDRARNISAMVSDTINFKP
jgi:hypothetical protein